MSFREHDFDTHIADLEPLAIAEQLVPLGSVGRESIPKIIDVFPELLNLGHFLANACGYSGLILQVASRREMIGVGVCVENPLQLIFFLLDMVQQLISGMRCRGSGVRIKV